MQHLDPGGVRESLIPTKATPETWPDPHMFSRDVVRVARPFEELSPDGVVGRPSLATPELGRRLFEAAVERGAGAVERMLR
jgi:creatinine amidohydrolase